MSEVKVIGRMDNTKDRTFESANRVYDTNAVSPTIVTSSGGDHTAKILEVEVIGGMGEQKSNNGTQYYQQDRVYNKDKICPALNSSGEELAPKILESENVVFIRQATKEGSIPCKIGGGRRFELSRLEDKARKSPRERRCKSDSDNGEYP